MYNFSSANLFDEAIPTDKHKPPFTYRTVFDTMGQNYFIMIVFNSLIIIEEDICLKIKCLQSPPNIPAFKFRYWLNASSVCHQIGKVELKQVHQFMKGNDYINMKDLMDL